MRHLVSLLAGLVIAPLAWIFVAAGQPRSVRTFERWSQSDAVATDDLLAPLALLATAGLLVGLIGVLRWSPLGPLVAGAVYLAGYVYAFVDPIALLDALPVWRIAGNRVDVAAPLTNGTLAVVGVALLLAVFSGQRWRRWPSPSNPAPEPTRADDAGPDNDATMDKTGIGQPILVTEAAAEPLPQRQPLVNSEPPAPFQTQPQSLGESLAEALSQQGASQPIQPTYQD